MPEFVRVRDKDTKHEYSVVASAVDPDFQTVIDRPAANCDGTPLPAKHHVSLSSKALSSPTPSGQSAGPEKE